MTATGAVMARFMERRGRHVVKGAGTYWYAVSGAMYQGVRHNVIETPATDEVEELLRKERLLGLRYHSKAIPGLPGGVYVCRDREYGLATVQKRMRCRIRRALEQCRFEVIDFDRLRVEGLRLNRETLERQGRRDSEFTDPRTWARLLRAARDTAGIQVHGMLYEGELASYVISCAEGGWINLLHQFSRNDKLDMFCNHALTFSMLEMGMRDPAIEGVCGGVAPLVALDKLHDYKLRMGYEFLPAFSVFHLHPVAAPLLSNGLTRNALRLLRCLLPGEQSLERATSVLEGARLFRKGAAVFSSSC